MFLAGASALALAPSLSRAEPRVGDELYDGILDKALALSPETATALGLDKGARAALKHKLDDRSEAHRYNFYDAIIEAEPALKARAASPGSRDAIFRGTALWLAQTMEPFRRFSYGGAGGNAYPVAYVVSQVSGAYQALPDFLDTQHVIETKEDAETYLDRLNEFGPILDQETAHVRADAGRGVTPPGFILERTIAQLESFQKEQSGAAAGLVKSLVRRAAERKLAGDWAARAQRLVDGPIAEAAGRQLAALQDLHKAPREAAGVGALPDGQAFYQACLRFHTSTSLTPKAAHELGLDQVRAVTEQARAIMDRQNIKAASVGDGFKALNKDPAQLFPDDDAGRKAVLDYISGLVKDMYGRLPRAFATLPRTKLEVRRVPPAIELGAPGAYDQGGSIDGTRPGAIYFNLHDTADWPRWTIGTTAYHEGVPGHHLQGSLANEARDIPGLFKLLGFNAYVEGWALYAEQLADELGAYDDNPLGRLGMLQASLFRACRIVVDTGLHAQGWKREQAIAYLIDNAGSTPDDARREIERYCSWPGQACGYKIGHLEFLRLRDQAKTRLGAKFDLKGFHAAVLGYGAMPLEVMAQAVDAWVRSVG
jgi:uncharacterized protein (DUF885 family)